MPKSKILIIEDDYVTSANIKILLRQQGYDVVGIAETGIEAIQMIRNTFPDLIMIDIHIQGSIDGIETAKQVRRIVHVPIIFLTGKNDSKTINKAKRIEASSFIVKGPSLKEQLSAQVEFSLYKFKIEKEYQKSQDSLKDSEEKFRSIAQFASDAIVFIENDMKISFWNPSATKIFGYSSKDALGKELINLIIPEDIRDYYRNGFSDFRDTGQGEFIGKTIEIEANTKDGYYLPVEISLYTIKLKGRWCACAVIRDITIRKDTEKEFEQLIEELQISKDVIEQNANEVNSLNIKLTESESQLKDLNSSKDKFFSIIAHDLKGPFQGLIGYTEILARHIDNLPKDEIKELASQMHTSATHLLKLLENLLHWSRLQRGIIEFAPELFDVHHLVILNFNLLSSNASHKSIELINNVPSESYVFADLNMVNTILRNMISNAIKFTNINGNITIYSKDLKNGLLEVSVQDNGVGMDQNSIDKIFKLDKQITTLGTENEKGTGLGLVLCKDLIEKNGGTINVSSEIGKGTTFSFTLKKNEQN